MQKHKTKIKYNNTRTKSIAKSNCNDRDENACNDRDKEITTACLTGKWQMSQKLFSYNLNIHFDICHTKYPLEFIILKKFEF